MDKFYFQWHITNKCGNRCKHCYQTTYNEIETPLDMIRDLLKDIKEFCNEIEYEPMISFVGGDPFKHSQFLDILKITKDNIINDVSILGNPEILLDKPEIIGYLKEMNISDYQLSLDGIKETHDYIRYNGSFEKTLKAIELLSKNDINVHVMSTVSKTNYKEMKDVMDIAYKYGATSWSFARCVTDDKNLLLTPKDYAKFLIEIINKHEYYEGLGKPKLTKEPLLSLLYKDSCSMDGCSIGGTSLTILPDATIMACRRHPGSVLGKWSKDNNFINIFLFNEKLNNFREIENIKKCKNCTFLSQCRGCRAISYLNSKNDIFGEDPQCFIDIIQS